MSMNEHEAIGMIDVSEKSRTHRSALAEVLITCSEETLDRIEAGDTPKGNVLTAARTAGLMASKTTHHTLPHCHPIAVTHAQVAFTRQPGALLIRVGITALDRTGCEMEALHAASVTALTIYDMVKFTDEDLRIEGLRLVEKRGGKSDPHARPAS